MPPLPLETPYLMTVLVALAAGLPMLTFLLGRKSGLSRMGILNERLQARESDIDSLRRRLGVLADETAALRETNTALREDLSRQQTLLAEAHSRQEERQALLNNAREQMGLEFRNLANEILEQKGRAFTDLNRRNIQDLLNPLGERIRHFEKKVEETYDREAKERFSLAREIRALQELNTRIGEDAVNLTRALKGESKTQGTWGEVILERVLERSGLCRGREYEVQVNLKSGDGRSRQPDVIVHLPENKDVIIDAKVSLNAYERWCNEDGEDARGRHLKDHIQSIRKHIRDLSQKDYHRLEQVSSLDFVMLFLPVEAAFTLAVQHDSELFTEAFERNIVLVGPSTLLATLRTIQNIWRHEYQNKNAQDIAERAGALYDKFHGFVQDLEEVGRRLDQSHGAWEQAYRKLCAGRGNLVGQVEKLKLLGARASKQLDNNLLEEEDGA